MMKHSMMKKNTFTACLCTALLLGAFSVHAQLRSLSFSGSSGKKTAKNDTPTLINSDAMDMDLANDKIILLGNVDVQDKDMNIKCRKMIIFLGKTPSSAAGKQKGTPADGKNPSSGKTKKKNDPAAGNENNGKSVQKIECIGDVVITQKQEEGIAQQAFAGKAVYFALEEKIILTESPVVVKDGNRLEGESITLYTQTDRVLVVKPVSTFRGQSLGAGKSK